jgi:hypothetical protein
VVQDVLTSVEALIFHSSGHGKAKKKMCVFMVTCQKNLGSVSIKFLFFLLSAKPEIVVSEIRFRYFIFEISGKPSFVEAVDGLVKIYIGY